MIKLFFGTLLLPLSFLFVIPGMVYGIMYFGFLVGMEITNSCMTDGTKFLLNLIARIEKERE